MARDDFTLATKDALAKRVGIRCSNPNCRKWTSGPHVDPKKYVNIGVAAHITAASEGGPRFDNSLSTEERKSPDNGIWLCQACAKLVDSDASRYEIDVLNKWKEGAESFALSQLEAAQTAADVVAAMQLPGVQSLASYWAALQGIAEHDLIPAVFTASRETEVAALQQWLSGQPDSLFMQTSGLTDGLDFLAAVSTGENQDALLNAFIVRTSDAWHQLTERNERLVLVPDPTLQSQSADVVSAIEAGHFVFMSGPRGPIGVRSTERLRRQDHILVSDALIDSGFSQSRAQSLASASCGSSSILKRLITQHPESIFPDWSQGDVRSTLAPFILAGGWMHVDPEPSDEEPAPRIGPAPPIDVLVVQELVGCSPDELERRTSRWSGGLDPFFLRFGNSVLVSSREDAWYLLGDAVTDLQVKRFSDLAILVLEEDNPAFELKPDQRWMANLHGKTHSLSGELRRSIMETLALMSTYPTAERPDSFEHYKEVVESVLGHVLPSGAIWQRWASIGQHLPIVAEAAPALFLDRVEEDLVSNSPELPKLFLDQANPMFGGGALHCHLLWALEALAWSPEYLSRVVRVLGRLATYESSTSTLNSPANSLREVFLPWLWHTNASLEQRIEALKTLNDEEPEVGWNLITELLPSGYPSISSNTHMPRWRPWAEGWSRHRLQSEMFAYSMAIASLTIDVAGTNPDRWSEALEGLLQYDNDDITDTSLLCLDEICEHSRENTELAFSLWKSIRELLARHERHSRPSWMSNEPVRDRLETICDNLQPSDVVQRQHWLFGHNAELPGVDPREDYAAYSEALQEARVRALREIVNEESVEGVNRLLGLGVDAHMVGCLIGGERLLSLEEMDVPAVFDSNDNQRLVCVRGYILTWYGLESQDFVDAVPTAEWSDRHVATFAQNLPFNLDVWQWLTQCGSTVENMYWQSVSPFVYKPTEDELRVAVDRLLQSQRPIAAIELLDSGLLHQLALPTNLVADVLEAALTCEDAEDPFESRDVGRSIPRLIQQLQNDEAIDRDRLAQIEWGFLPLLDTDVGKVAPATLLQMTSVEPRFYIDLLKLAFRAKNQPSDESSISDHERLRASRAIELLESLNVLPGSNADGDVDLNYLQNWLNDVRALANDCDRIEVCDITLGQFFARASVRSMGDWPSPGIASIIEDVRSVDLRDGFVNGVLNSRGATWRDTREGGSPERALALRYRELSESVRLHSLTLEKAFLQLAEHYDSYARHEDERAERERLGR